MENLGPTPIQAQSRLNIEGGIRNIKHSINNSKQPIKNQLRNSKEGSMLSELSRNIGILPVKTEDEHSSFRRRMHKNYVSSLDKIVSGSRSNSIKNQANFKQNNDQMYININNRILPSYRISAQNGGLPEESKSKHSIKQETSNSFKNRDAIDLSSFNTETQNALTELQNLIDENISGSKSQQVSEVQGINKSISGMLNLSTSQAEDANLEHTNAQQLKKSESLSKFMQFKTNNLKLFEIDGKEITENS